MSAKVKLTTAMPAEDEWNGLDSEAEALNTHPDGIRYALVGYDNKGSIEDTDSGTAVPRVRVRLWEPLGERSEVADQIMEVATLRQEKRTGRKALPYGEHDDTSGPVD
jgi:hypothetical protein